MASEIEEVADFDDDDIDIEMDDLNEEGEGLEPQESVSAAQRVVQTPVVTDSQDDLAKHTTIINEVLHTQEFKPESNGASMQEFVEPAPDSTHLATSELAPLGSEVVEIETEESTQQALLTSESPSSESTNLQQSSAPVQAPSPSVSTSSISSDSLFRVPTLSFDGSSDGLLSHIPTPHLSSCSDIQSDILRTPTISASSSFSSSDSVTFGPDDAVLFSDDKQLFNSPISKLMSKLQTHFSIDADVVLHFPDLELKFITNLTFADKISPKELYSLTARLNKKKEGGAFLFKATLTTEAVSFSKKYRELLNLPYELVEAVTSTLSDSSESVVKPRHPAFVASRFLERGGDSGYEGDQDGGIEEEDEDELDDSGYAEDDESEQPAEPAIAHPREELAINGVVEERMEIESNGKESEHSTSTTESIAALSNGKRAREPELDQDTSDEPPAKKAKVDLSSEAAAEEEFVDI